MGPDKSVQIGPNERLLFTTVVEGNVLMLILDNLVASKYLRTYLHIYIQKEQNYHIGNKIIDPYSHIFF